MFDKAYTDYIKSPRWKMVCQKAYGVYGKRCQACGSRQKLHVHHKSYDRLGREIMTDLAVVCEPCHREIHRLHRRDKRVSLRLVTDRYIAQKRRA